MSTQSPSRTTARQGATRGQRADRGELAVSTTSPEWEGRPHHRRLPRLTSLLIVLAVLALCVVLAVTQISRRLSSRNDVKVSQTVLTADPIQFEAAASGSVTEVKVTKGDKVAAGQTLIVLSYINPLGSEVPAVNAEFKAPVAGIISSVNVTTGEAVIGGAPLVSMYDPAKMYFEVPMLYKAAEDIKKDMSAVLDVPGIGEVEGTVVGIQSDFGEAGADNVERLAKVVVLPNNPSDVADAAPGIISDGKIKKSTAPADARSVVFYER